MRRRAINRKGFLRDTAGAAAIEFAIVSVAFLTFFFAIAYMAVILFTNATLQWAVERGSRLAAINPAVTQSEIADTINGYLAAAGAPTANVTYSVTQSGAVKLANISAGFSETYTVPLIDTFAIDYTASTAVPQS